MNAGKETQPTFLGGLAFDKPTVNQEITFSHAENVTHNHRWLQTMLRGSGAEAYSPDGSVFFIDAFEYVYRNSIVVFVATTAGIYRLTAGPLELIVPFTIAATTVHEVLQKTNCSFVAWDDRVYCAAPNGKLYCLYLVATSDGKNHHMVSSPYENVKNLAVFENHLILADFTSASLGVGVGQAAIAWSDLYRPEALVPGEQGSEADLFLLDPETTSVTGLIANRSSCFVFTPNNIFSLTYQPYPVGIRVAQAISGVGATRYGSIVQTSGRIYFNHNFDFYCLDGAQLIPIGAPVSEFFKSSVDVYYPQGGMRAFINLFSGHVVWIYIEKIASGDEVNALVFSLTSGQWTTSRNPDLCWCSLFTIVYEHVLSIGELDRVYVPGKTTLVKLPSEIYPSSAPVETTYAGPVLNKTLLSIEGWPSVTGDEGFKCSSWTSFFGDIGQSWKTITLITNYFIFDSLVKSKLFDRIAISFNSIAYQTAEVACLVEIDAKSSPNDPDNWTPLIRGDSALIGQNVWFMTIPGSARMVRFRITFPEPLDLTRIEAITLSGVDTNPDEVI